MSRRYVFHFKKPKADVCALAIKLAAPLVDDVRVTMEYSPFGYKVAAIKFKRIENIDTEKWNAVCKGLRDAGFYPDVLHIMYPLHMMDTAFIGDIEHQP